MLGVAVENSGRCGVCPCLGSRLVKLRVSQSVSARFQIRCSEIYLSETLTNFERSFAILAATAAFCLTRAMSRKNKKNNGEHQYEEDHKDI